MLGGRTIGAADVHPEPEPAEPGTVPSPAWMTRASTRSPIPFHVRPWRVSPGRRRTSRRRAHPVWRRSVAADHAAESNPQPAQRGERGRHHRGLTRSTSGAFPPSVVRPPPRSSRPPAAAHPVSRETVPDGLSSRPPRCAPPRPAPVRIDALAHPVSRETGAGPVQRASDHPPLARWTPSESTQGPS